MITVDEQSEALGDIFVEDRLDSIFEFNERADSLGWGDGLPLMPPTESRVEAMLQAVGDSPEALVAVLQPQRGKATLRTLAICAVMAGCSPWHFPAVVAAVRAVADRRFGLDRLNTTTNPVAPLLVLNGPARERLGLNCSYGVLGPGTRANATIGRALSLALSNIAGRVPGKLSRTTHGQPGRYTFCLGEYEEVSPWAPLHVEKGLLAEESFVTAYAPTGTTNILETNSKTAEGILFTVAGSMTNIGSLNFFPYFGQGPMLLLLCPDHAQKIAQGGFSKQDVKQFLFDETSRRVPLSAWSPEVRDQLVATGRVHDGFVPLAARPDQFEIVVAGGGGGLHSVFFPTYGDSWPCTQRIEMPEA